MRAEADDKAAERESDFQTNLFIHDRPAWEKLFPSDEAIADDEENWVTADDPGFDDLLAEMGLILDD